MRFSQLDIENKVLGYHFGGVTQSYLGLSRLLPKLEGDGVGRAAEASDVAGHI